MKNQSVNPTNQTAMSIGIFFLLFFNLFYQILETKAGCGDGILSEIQGPISECNAFSGPCSYNLTNPGAGTISWICVGGTVSFIGSHATVNWTINQSVYSLTAIFTNPVMDTPPCSLI